MFAPAQRRSATDVGAAVFDAGQECPDRCHGDVLDNFRVLWLAAPFPQGTQLGWYFAAWGFMGLGVITKGVGFLPLLLLLPLGGTVGKRACGERVGAGE